MRNGGLQAHSCRLQAPTASGKHLHTKEQLPRIPQWWKNNFFFFLELGPQRLLLVSENIFSQNIFLPTTQGPGMKNIFCKSEDL